MEKKLAIIGSEVDRNTIKKEIDKSGIDDLIVVTPDEYKNMAETDIAMDSRYLKLEYIKPLEINLYGNRPFICKGKHQYRAVEKKEGNIINVEWVCQCGRKL